MTILGDVVEQIYIVDISLFTLLYFPPLANRIESLYLLYSVGRQLGTNKHVEINSSEFDLYKNFT